MVDLQFTDRPLVIGSAGLDHSDRLAHLALCFEEAQHHDAVGQVADIEIRTQVAHDAVLSQDHQRHHTLLRQVA